MALVGGSRIAANVFMIMPTHSSADCTSVATLTSYANPLACVTSTLRLAIPRGRSPRIASRRSSSATIAGSLQIASTSHGTSAAVLKRWRCCNFAKEEASCAIKVQN